MALLALFQALLARWSGQRDFTVGVPTSGRDGRGAEDLSDVVGYFVNPVPMRAELAGDPCLTDLLDRGRASALAAFEHAELPFPLLAERLQPERDPARSPIFQVMFVHQNLTKVKVFVTKVNMYVVKKVKQVSKAA